jgi:ABC-type Fe3+-hydroxamate transport system substrate-binding protein
MWTDPLITVGAASFTDWLVRAAGGANVFGDIAFDSAQIGLESLIQRNPEVLVFLTEQAPFVKSLDRRPGWSSIRGVRDRRYCFIDEPDIRRSIMFIDGLIKLQDCILGYGPSAASERAEPK